MSSPDKPKEFINTSADKSDEEIEPQPPNPSSEEKETSEKVTSLSASTGPSTEPVVAEPVSHHRSPTLTKCPNCETEVVSKVTYKNGLCVWLSCAGCAAVGGILGCCLIPFYITSFKDVDHSCPNCSYRLGVCKAL